MNEDYLWDKTGEPDPQIEHLERVLGTLRYQPQQFEIPKESRIERKRSWISLVAIAATVAIAVVAAGLWVASNRPSAAQIAMVVLPVEESPRVMVVPLPDEPKPTGTTVVRKRPTVHRSQLSEETLAERREAEKAKQQLLLALRVTSSKLSIAQKKVQGAPTGLIRNQHKIG
jgi:negative regulator of sigma E activity